MFIEIQKLSNSKYFMLRKAFDYGDSDALDYYDFRKLKRPALNIISANETQFKMKLMYDKVLVQKIRMIFGDSAQFDKNTKIWTINIEGDLNLLLTKMRAFTKNVANLVLMPDFYNAVDDIKRTLEEKNENN